MFRYQHSLSQKYLLNVLFRCISTDYCKYGIFSTSPYIINEIFLEQWHSKVLQSPFKIKLKNKLRIRFKDNFFPILISSKYLNILQIRMNNFHSRFCCQHDFQYNHCLSYDTTRLVIATYF